MLETANPERFDAFEADYLSIVGTEAEFGFIYNFHPGEQTSGKVADSLLAAPITNLVPVEGNQLAASLGQRYVHGELGSSLQLPETLLRPVTYEQARIQWLWLVYRGLRGVIDCHNNKNLRTTFGSIGPNADPITLHMAGLLGVKDIVIMGEEHWSWYNYFKFNKNLLLIEGHEEDQGYNVDWWRKGLARLIARNAMSGMSESDFRFFDRLPDITMTKAKKAKIENFPWEPNLETPLPEEIAVKLGITDGTPIYALAWPTGTSTSYAAPGVDYFGEIVAEMPPPFRMTPPIASKR